MTIRLQIISKM